ncbi:unnamed protein product, partial [Didymodactylos carnosus]
LYQYVYNFARLLAGQTNSSIADHTNNTQFTDIMKNSSLVADIQMTQVQLLPLIKARNALGFNFTQSPYIINMTFNGAISSQLTIAPNTSALREIRVSPGKSNVTLLQAKFFLTNKTWTVALNSSLNNTIKIPSSIAYFSRAEIQILNTSDNLPPSRVTIEIDGADCQKNWIPSWAYYQPPPPILMTTLLDISTAPPHISNAQTATGKGP